jgi:hypothetical protein
VASGNEVNIKRYTDERLPSEGENVWLNLTAITKEAWNSVQDPFSLIVSIKLIINTFTILANDCRYCNKVL